jgi:hypothetical protein
VYYGSTIDWDRVMHVEHVTCFTQLVQPCDEGKVLRVTSEWKSCPLREVSVGLDTYITVNETTTSVNRTYVTREAPT